MSEEAEVIEGEPSPEEETAAPTELTYDEKHEVKARKGGWKPEDEFEGKSEDWVDARDFNNRGEYINQLKSQQAKLDQVDTRIANLNQMNEAKLSVQRQELMQRRDLLIEAADVVGVKQVEQQIQSLAPVQQVPAEDPAVTSWNANNPWILEDTPKAAYARDVYQRNGGAANAINALMEVNKEMEKHYSGNKDKAPISEGGSSPQGNKVKTRNLTMNDLTPEESKMRQFFPHFKDEKVFLQAVTDARKTK